MLKLSDSLLQSIFKNQSIKKLFLKRSAYHFGHTELLLRRRLGESLAKGSMCLSG